MMSNNATKINAVFRGIFPANRAAMGAAKTPPIINPNMISIFETPRLEKKTIAAARVTKNSAMLTVPMT